VAGVADIYAKFRLVGKHGKTVAACAADLTLNIFGMDAFFHLDDSLCV
jgi:hypothetical protein